MCATMADVENPVAESNLRTIEYLDVSGHLALTWDPGIPESVERARAEFDQLRQAGYQFFVAFADEPADSFQAQVGALRVQRVDPSVVEPRLEPAISLVATEEQPRRGRARVVAGRPMRGG